VGNILVKDGKLISDNGKIVIINSEDCNCCKPVCDPFFVPTCGDGEVPEKRALKFEVDVPTDGENISFSTTSITRRKFFSKSRFGECIPLENGDSTSEIVETDTTYSFVTSGLSALSGTYFTEQVGNESNDLCLNSSEVLNVPIVPFTGVFTWDTKIFIKTTCVGACPSWKTIFDRDYTCSGSIPFEGEATFDWRTLGPGSIPGFFNRNVGTGGHVITSFFLNVQLYPLRDFTNFVSIINVADQKVEAFIAQLQSVENCDMSGMGTPGLNSCLTEPAPQLPPFLPQTYFVAPSKRCPDTDISSFRLPPIEDIYCETELGPTNNIFTCPFNPNIITSTSYEYRKRVYTRLGGESIQLTISDA